MTEYQKIVMGVVNELIKDKPVLKMFPDDVSWGKIKGTTKYEDVPEEERDMTRQLLLTASLLVIPGRLFIGLK